MIVRIKINTFEAQKSNSDYKGRSSFRAVSRTDEQTELEQVYPVADDVVTGYIK